MFLRLSGDGDGYEAKGLGLSSLARGVLMRCDRDW